MWDKPEEATLLMKKINDIESELNDYNSLLKELRELRFMVELSEEYGDEKEYIIELKKLKNLERRVVDYSYSQMLTGEYDTGDAVVQIHSINLIVSSSRISSMPMFSASSIVSSL